VGRHPFRPTKFDALHCGIICSISRDCAIVSWAEEVDTFPGGHFEFVGFPMGQSISGSIGTVVTKRSGWLGDFEEMAAEKRTIYLQFTVRHSPRYHLAFTAIVS
jgi:hypothetical protein